MIKIATYNANSLRIRIDHFMPWLHQCSPDIVLVQETKVEDASFPAQIFNDAGYHTAFHGQKSYNGVAILSRHPIENVKKGLSHFDDESARAISATIMGIRCFSLYIPNGNPVDSDKYPYKLAFLQALYNQVQQELLPQEQPFFLAGDFNICPHDADCHDPNGFANDALCLPEVRQYHRKLCHMGLVDAWRHLNPLPQAGYSYWDYQAGRFYKDEGLRIDHFLLSPELADRLEHAGIATDLRAKPRPSDHTPVWIKLREK